MAEINEKNTAGDLDRRTQNIREQKETKYTVTLSSDRTRAYLSIYPKNTMAFEITTDELQEKLKTHRVTYGIDINVLNDIARRLASSGTPIENVLVATGSVPVEGKDAQMELLVDTAIKSIGKENKDGTIDYKQKESILKVIAGQSIARYYKPIAGTPGTAVDGTVIGARSGKDLKVTLENVEFCEEEGVFKAACDGQLFPGKSYLGVKTIRTIEGDVDLETGCIDFPGTVVIKGSVLNEFYVKARGDIFINGSVSDALIECAGELKVREGITGSFKTKIQCDGSILAGYIQNSSVSSGDSIRVTRDVYSSTLVARDKITVENELIGGFLTAGQEITVKHVGSETGVETILEVGIKTEVRDQLQKVTDKINACTQNIDKIQNSLGEKIYKLPVEMIEILFKDKAKDILRILELRNGLISTKTQLEKEKDDLIKQETMVSDSASIKVRGTIHPYTKIIIKGKKMVVSNSLTYVRFYMDKHDQTLKWATL